MINDKYIYLPKGGMIFDTSIGAIQFGAPPETIKDSMSLNRAVPTFYIAPKNLFSHKKMSSFIDIEFPCYFNYYVLHKSITIFCTKKQSEAIGAFFSESYFGPKELNLEIEYIDGKDNPYFPDMEKELKYFSTHPTENRRMVLEDFIEFVILQENKTITYKDITFFLDVNNNKIKINDKGVEYELDWNLDYDNSDDKKNESDSIFIPPSFGITTLGSSHGFDPKGKTSGFIFWINGSGIMIDPPIDSALWLIDENVDPRMVNSVILTHCHSDHDAGVMQKILQEGRVTLYTTSTIFTSFIKKTSLLTGLNEIDIVELIDFIPVMIGKPININGAMVTFNYRLHSIPTIGFEVFFKGKTVVYTSDHLNGKKYFDNLKELGILPDGRYEELNNFNWRKDIIIHEAGIPPLHTPIEVLLELPDDVKKNIFLVHTDKSKIPEGSNLTVSPTGLSNTMNIKVQTSIHSESVQILNLVSGLDIFMDIKFEKSAEFLSIIKYRKFKKDECLIKEGDFGKRFYIIVAGRAKLIEKGLEKAILTSGSYFGETALILNRLTTGTLIALTDIIAIIIEKEDFLMFLANTPVYERLKKLGAVRSQGSWEAIELNPLFNSMTINQKNQLELLFNFEKVNKNEVVIHNNKALDFAFIWNTGSGVIKDKNNKIEKTLKKGDFVGNPMYLVGEKVLDKTVIAVTDSTIFKINWDSMLKFYQKNPRILLELRDKDEY